jgi:hypothetical protein
LTSIAGEYLKGWKLVSEPAVDAVKLGSDEAGEETVVEHVR